PPATGPNTHVRRRLGDERARDAVRPPVALQAGVRVAAGAAARRLGAATMRRRSGQEQQADDAQKGEYRRAAASHDDLRETEKPLRCGCSAMARLALIPRTEVEVPRERVLASLASARAPGRDPTELRCGVVPRSHPR